MATGLNASQFQNADKAREYLEGQVWPNGPICPHCGVIGKHWALEGETTRPGLYKCTDCREPFTVTVGTVFERSKIPLHKWLLAVYLLCSSKKGMSSHQMHRTLGVTYKTAWFMTHRIRKAMEARSFAPMGGGGGTVEADETFFGTKPGANKHARGGYAHKNAIFSLVERGGKVRSFHVPNVTAKTLKPILESQMATDAHLMTDDGRQYLNLGPISASHETVAHTKGEYVRG